MYNNVLYLTSHLEMLKYFNLLEGVDSYKNLIHLVL